MTLKRQSQWMTFAGYLSQSAIIILTSFFGPSWLSWAMIPFTAALFFCASRARRLEDEEHYEPVVDSLKKTLKTAAREIEELKKEVNK